MRLHSRLSKGWKACAFPSQTSLAYFLVKYQDCRKYAGLETRKCGYIRMNRNGKKIFCYVLVDSVHPWYNDKLDVSHLCGNPKCCNKHHLWSKTHRENLSRKGCPGYTFLLEDADTRSWLVLCTHFPTCMKVTPCLPCTKPVDKHLIEQFMFTERTKTPEEV